MALIETVSAYPPEHHVLRDLALEVQPGRTINRVWMPVTEHVCNARGHVRAGAVITMVDAICGGLAATAAAPGWIATADLTYHVAAPVVGEELNAIARIRRAGRTTVVLEAEVYNELHLDIPQAVATATFSVLPRRDQNPELERPLTDDEPRRAFVGDGERFVEDIYGACGFSVIEGPAVEVGLSEYILNSLGGVQGGILGSLADHATNVALGEDFETVDVQLTYLALGKVGPIRATPTVLYRSPTSGVVDVELFDVGAQRRTTVARCAGVIW